MERITYTFETDNSTIERIMENKLMFGIQEIVYGEKYYSFHGYSILRFLDEYLSTLFGLCEEYPKAYIRFCYGWGTCKCICINKSGKLVVMKNDYGFIEYEHLEGKEMLVDMTTNSEEVAQIVSKFLHNNQKIQKCGIISAPSSQHVMDGDRRMWKINGGCDKGKQLIESIRAVNSSHNTTILMEGCNGLETWSACRFHNGNMEFIPFSKANVHYPLCGGSLPIEVYGAIDGVDDQLPF